MTTRLSPSDRSIDPSDIYADLAVERGDWELAASLYARYAQCVADIPTELSWVLRRAAVALAQLGADEAAIEIAAAAGRVMEALDDELQDFWVTKYGAELTAARQRLNPANAEAAARRGRALSPPGSARRAIEPTQTRSDRAR
jgi:hypothetical protein